MLSSRLLTRLCRSSLLTGLLTGLPCSRLVIGLLGGSRPALPLHLSFCLLHGELLVLRHLVGSLTSSCLRRCMGMLLCLLVLLLLHQLWRWWLLLL